jgi:NADPH2:quinone reductase
MLTPQLCGLTAAREHQVEILRQCGEWIDQGLLKLRVSQMLPLEQAAEGIARSRPAGR